LSSNIFQDKQVEDAHSLNKVKEQLQILIAESESDLLTLFREYLSSLGMKTETACSGHEAMEQFLKRKDKRPYDAIVLNTHLYSPSGLDVAKKIHSENTDQKLVLVTTTPIEYLSKECLKTAGITDRDILTMPFKLSNLVEVLKN
jgi:two-component system, OmpR family, response regulator